MLILLVNAELLFLLKWFRDLPGSLITNLLSQPTGDIGIRYEDPYQLVRPMHNARYRISKSLSSQHNV